jgi:hypothetical protein
MNMNMNMNMNMKHGMEVANESWCDVRLDNLSWCNEGRDLKLTFFMHEGKTGKLTCTWAHTINISLISGNNEGGYLLTFDATINETNNNCWEVSFDFASRGVVELKCNELTLELCASS